MFLLVQGGGYGGGELVGAGCCFVAASDACQALCKGRCMHFFGEGSYALCVAATAACKAYVVHYAVGIDIEVYEAGAYSRGFVGEVFHNGCKVTKFR